MRLIVGEFYKGQGLGNQLYTYASVRGLAKMCGVGFAFAAPHLFKGHDLFDLDFGETTFDYPSLKLYERRLVDPCCGHDVGATDADLVAQLRAAEDSIKVEGLLAAKGYWPGGRDFLRDVLPLRASVLRVRQVHGRGTIVHVRGGDFLGSNSKLDAGYYHAALDRLAVNLGEVNVLTDDPDHARRLLGPDIRILSDQSDSRHEMTASHHQGGSFVHDFVVFLHARQIVLSNSSFAFWAAALNLAGARVIAPRYWAARGCATQHWSPGDLQLAGFEYV